MTVNFGPDGLSIEWAWLNRCTIRHFAPMDRLDEAAHAVNNVAKGVGQLVVMPWGKENKSMQTQSRRTATSTKPTLN